MRYPVCMSVDNEVDDEVNVEQPPQAFPPRLRPGDLLRLLSQPPDPPPTIGVSNPTDPEVIHLGLSSSLPDLSIPESHSPVFPNAAHTSDTRGNATHNATQLFSSSTPDISVSPPQHPGSFPMEALDIPAAPPPIPESKPAVFSTPKTPMRGYHPPFSSAAPRKPPTLHLALPVPRGGHGSPFAPPSLAAHSRPLTAGVNHTTSTAAASVAGGIPAASRPHTAAASMPGAGNRRIIPPPSLLGAGKPASAGEVIATSPTRAGMQRYARASRQFPLSASWAGGAAAREARSSAFPSLVPTLGSPHSGATRAPPAASVASFSPPELVIGSAIATGLEQTHLEGFKHAQPHVDLASRRNFPTNNSILPDGASGNTTHPPFAASSPASGASSLLPPLATPPQPPPQPLPPPPLPRLEPPFTVTAGAAAAAADALRRHPRHVAVGPSLLSASWSPAALSIPEEESPTPPSPLSAAAPLSPTSAHSAAGSVSEGRRPTARQADVTTVCAGDAGVHSSATTVAGTSTRRYTGSASSAAPQPSPSFGQLPTPDVPASASLAGAMQPAQLVPHSPTGSMSSDGSAGARGNSSLDDSTRMSNGSTTDLLRAGTPLAQPLRAQQQITNAGSSAVRTGAELTHPHTGSPAPEPRRQGRTTVATFDFAAAVEALPPEAVRRAAEEEWRALAQQPLQGAVGGGGGAAAAAAAVAAAGVAVGMGPRGPMWDEATRALVSQRDAAPSPQPKAVALFAASMVYGGYGRGRRVNRW